MPNRTKPGAEPSQAALSYVEESERRGGRGPRDSVLIARCADVAIWQTEKSDPQDELLWCPPFDPVKHVLYRGFKVAQLPTVLETGLDVPPQSAFFATESRAYAWQYPHTRDIAAMLVLDGSQTKRSCVYTNLTEPDQPLTVDKATYPNEYEYDGIRVHTRFDHADGRGTHTLSDEIRYGYWIPGDAHAALIAVVLGGPHTHVLRNLQACAPTDLELVG